MAEKRKHPRTNISFPVECSVLPQRKYFYTVSRDLSLGGVKILSNIFLPKNDSFKLTINLIDKTLDVKAKVAWCNSERMMDRYSAGLEFVEINQTSQKGLSGFLDKIFLV
tara:strand:+ start:364 stop:693 length:330 start_codon:yes stop_codon:yes gene_type:complete